MNERTVRLGDRVFFVSPSGLISQTLVFSLDTEGYSPLQSLWGTSFLDVHEAVREAAVLASRAPTRSGIAYTASLTNDPMGCARELLAETRFKNENGRICDVAKTPVGYFLPGQTVWQVVTPSSFCSVAENSGYRIASYFVLESVVRSVTTLFDGVPQYLFDTCFDASRVERGTYAQTAYEPERLCRSVEEAILKLCEVVLDETPAKSVAADKVRCVSQAEQQEHDRRLMAGIERIATAHA